METHRIWRHTGFLGLVESVWRSHREQRWRASFFWYAVTRTGRCLPAGTARSGRAGAHVECAAGLAARAPFEVLLTQLYSPAPGGIARVSQLPQQLTDKPDRPRCRARLARRVTSQGALSSGQSLLVVGALVWWRAVRTKFQTALSRESPGALVRGILVRSGAARKARAGQHQSPSRVVARKEGGSARARGRRRPVISE